MENIDSPVLQGLNSEQLAAVQCTQGPILIVAGAGSGKTRVLTSRIAYILSQGCDAGRILALTFTKKAATEMKERISLMVGRERARRLAMGTFHSVFVRFLREYAESLGYPHSFTIHDTSDSLSAIKACIKELQLDDKQYKPKDCLSRISMAKNNLFTADLYRNDPKVLETDRHSRRPRLCDVYSLYVNKCRQSGVMDFDDILLNMNILLRDNPEALESISSRFQYILVDEYQDTNYAQYLILKKLAIRHRNICVVGDDSQSIYAFRGAKIENILNFRKDYPESRIFRLERNYRSTRNIVDAANSLISHNSGRIPKNCYSEGPEGDRIRLISASSEKMEAELIISAIIAKMREHKAEYRDFAILYRTNSQSRILEEKLRSRNIPYMIYSGNSFFERAEVKDMMAYLKLAANPQDDESFKRVVNKPARGIGATSLDALELAARSHGISLFKAAAMDDLESFGLKAAAARKIQDFCLKVNAWAMAAAGTDAHELALTIADQSGLYRYFKEDSSIEGVARAANVGELLDSVLAYIEDRQSEYYDSLDDVEAEKARELGETVPVTLGEFLENVSLLSNADTSEDGDSGNKVALMTVHSAKGLEFPYVFVAGMEENIFPPGGMMTSPADIEEERRLFYVAVTRACKAVELSFAESRIRNGKTEYNSPSRFIKEIDTQYIDNPLEDDVEVRGLMPFRMKYDNSPVSRYGRSGDVRYERRGTSPDRRIQRTVHSESSIQVSRAGVLSRPLPPKTIPDSEFVPVPASQVRVGMVLEHNRFGLGTVRDVSGVAPDLKATIEFDEFGVKQILLKYGKLRIPKD